MTRALVNDGAVRVIFVEAEGAVVSLCQAHGLEGASARLAAEASVATLLLSAYAKGAEKLTLQVAGSNPQFRWLGELDPRRQFRGKLWGEDVSEGMDLHSLKGVMQVAKYVDSKEVYRGITDLADASIVGALRQHLIESSQVAGVLACEIQCSPSGQVTSARGVLAERLPEDGDKPTLQASEFEQLWGSLGSADVPLVFEGLKAGSILGTAPQILETVPAIWGCTCSEERVLSAIAGLPPSEIQNMVDEDGGAVVNCDFCNTRYEIAGPQLLALLGD